MKRKKLKTKTIRKLYDKCCFFCGVDVYELLDAHRIYEGKDGGGYIWENILTVCSLCHRKIHAGIIQILGRHLCTNGQYVIRYLENGEEKFKC
jgi:hypothetical protein